VSKDCSLPTELSIIIGTTDNRDHKNDLNPAFTGAFVPAFFLLPSIGDIQPKNSSLGTRVRFRLEDIGWTAIIENIQYACIGCFTLVIPALF
jgi:hypothetical protein